MPEYRAPWFYRCGSIELLETAESVLRKSWIIPLEFPWNMFSLAVGNADIPRFAKEKEKFAVICPNSWDWFSVYDATTEYGLYAGDSLHTALELWAVDTDRHAVFGFVRSNQSVYGEILIPAKLASQEDLQAYIANTLKYYNE